LDAALRDVLDRLLVASEELDRWDANAAPERAAELALNVTRSSQAVIALGERDAEPRIYTCDDDGGRLTESVARELLAVAGGAASVAGRSVRTRLAVIGAEVRAGETAAGTIAVCRPREYTDADRQALAIFATLVGRALNVSALRAEVDVEDEQRKRTAERLRTAERVERAHELAVQVLLAVSSHAVAGLSLADFYRRLARTVSELVGAERVLFWRLDDKRMLAPAGGFGVDRTMLSRLPPVKVDPGQDDLGSAVVFRDLIFRAANPQDPVEFAYVLDRIGVNSAISVPWRAGEQRLGLVAAYDSTRQGGFSREDTWVLQKAGLAAGLVTQLWQAQEDLRKSVDRLTKVDGARQLLLKNMTSVVERERKRLASELHDDALQKLTAAELHLARLKPGEPLDGATVEKLSSLLQDTEASLRRLVFDVRPPALETPDGLAQSIRDRAALLAAAGIKSELEIDLPTDLSLDVKSMIFRQIAEAIGNAERHSHATKVKVSLRRQDAGVHGMVVDDGRGFVVAERSNLPGHLGLLALRERALMAGGWYKIESAPGAGTHIEFWIPLDR
jgi:signal transduction histidine kinase